MNIRSSAQTRRVSMTKSRRNIRISSNNNSLKQTVYNRNSLMTGRVQERKTAVTSIKYPLHKRRTLHKSRV